MSFGSVIIGTEVNNVLVSLFPLSDEEVEPGAAFVSGGLVSVTALCLISPFVEEMLFRGIFLRSLLQLYSPGRAILLSAVVFGIAHFNIYRFVAASMFGVLTGWFYYATGSVWPGILEHALGNGSVYLYDPSVPEALRRVAEPVSIHSTPTLALSIATFAVAPWWLLKVLPPTESAQ